mmetsp:Transcript_93468/g.250378  ORF Transcript_93468/g.250378 Transcript_93468/m.250378 type:complete len:244 (-) Transcript_93468:14-745(-)
MCLCIDKVLAKPKSPFPVGLPISPPAWLLKTIANVFVATVSSGLPPVSDDERALDEAVGHALSNGSTRLVVQAGPGDPPAFECLPDHAKPCPSGWLHDLDGWCVAPRGFRDSPSCPREVDMTDWNAMRRADFEHACGVQWPCQQTCPQDFAGCPSVWHEQSDGSCAAPDAYSGPCASTLHVDRLTEDSKRQLQFRCGVRWPCAATPGQAATSGALGSVVLVCAASSSCCANRLKHDAGLARFF